jgi:hypothetical protein
VEDAAVYWAVVRKVNEASGTPLAGSAFDKQTAADEAARKKAAAEKK